VRRGGGPTVCGVRQQNGVTVRWNCPQDRSGSIEGVRSQRPWDPPVKETDTGRVRGRPSPADTDHGSQRPRQCRLPGSLRPPTPGAAVTRWPCRESIHRSESPGPSASHRLRPSARAGPTTASASTLRRCRRLPSCAALLPPRDGWPGGLTLRRLSRRADRHSGARRNPEGSAPWTTPCKGGATRSDFRWNEDLGQEGDGRWQPRP
jgi:hypothetical protein